MKKPPHPALPRIALALVLLTSPQRVRADPGTVAVKTSPGKAWTEHATRSLAALPPVAADPPVNRYGGWPARRDKATGFFYPKKVGGRWWLVDPEGCLFLHKAVVAVSPMRGPGAMAAFAEKFGSDRQWAETTTRLLRDHGFNGLGAWSDNDQLREAGQPLVYTRILNFMSAYGHKRGGTYQKSGHIGYPKDTIFVFDPEFAEFCDGHAKQLASTRDDPWLLGHFSDNELPIRREALENYLQLPAGDPGHRAARAWLDARHGPPAAPADITDQDRKDFLALVTDRYYRIVAAAIRKHDPNHLFLGSRLHGGELNFPEVFKAAGAHVDVMAVNYYRTWTPSQDKLAMWSRESGRPILVTEWYVKGEDSGLANTSGAGWIVKTQRDRGLFYQHFTLGLLESKVCVGWHWFKYIDNDPREPGTDPSNRDANKGVVTSRYQPYPALLDAMKPLNDRVYNLTRQFDGPQPP